MIPITNSPISLFPKLLKPKNLKRITSGICAAGNLGEGLVNTHKLGNNLAFALDEAMGSKTHNDAWSFEYLDTKFLQISSGFSLQRAELNNLKKGVEDIEEFFGQELEGMAGKIEKKSSTITKKVQWNHLFSVAAALITGFAVLTLCVVVTLLGFK